MDSSYFMLQGRFDRWQYLAGLVVSGLVWMLVHFFFEGPASEQFADKPVIAQAIAVVPALLVFLFASIKRFRDIGANWGWRLLFLGATILAATVDLFLPDFNLRFPFYERVLNSLWATGAILLLLWTSPESESVASSQN